MTESPSSIANQGDVMRIIIQIFLLSFAICYLAFAQCGPGQKLAPIGGGRFSCVNKDTPTGASNLTTAGAVPRVSSSGVLSESAIKDDGTTVTISGRSFKLDSVGTTKAGFVQGTCPSVAQTGYDLTLCAESGQLCGVTAGGTKTCGLGGGVTQENVLAVFTGTGDYLKSDGTKGTPSVGSSSLLFNLQAGYCNDSGNFPNGAWMADRATSVGSAFFCARSSSNSLLGMVFPQSTTNVFVHHLPLAGTITAVTLRLWAYHAVGGAPNAGLTVEAACTTTGVWDPTYTSSGTASWTGITSGQMTSTSATLTLPSGCTTGAGTRVLWVKLGGRTSPSGDLGGDLFVYHSTLEVTP